MGGPTHSDLPTPRLSPLLASWALTVHLGWGSGRLPGGDDVLGNTYRKEEPARMQGVPIDCTTCPRSHQQGHVARAIKQEQGQQDLRQGTGPKGQGKDPDLILRADVGRGMSEMVRSLF